MLNKRLIQALGQIVRALHPLKEHPEFMNYLTQWGTLKAYGETNIGSRPTSRAKDGPLISGDLRAIPFVGLVTWLAAALRVSSAWGRLLSG